jgi:hypothetical protein
MELTIKLSSDEIDIEDIQYLTESLCESINQHTDINAFLEEKSEEIGTKGDAITLGTIIMTLIGSGGVAVKLIQVLKAYIDRGKHIKIKITSKQGELVEVEMANLGNDQIGKTTELISKMFGEIK